MEQTTLDRIKNQIIDWLKIGKFFKYKEENFITENENCIKATLYTDTNKYIITAKENYLGCTSTSRKQRAGENWFRGNDLGDGPFSKETWIKILSDILTYELVDIKSK